MRGSNFVGARLCYGHKCGKCRCPMPVQSSAGGTAYRVEGTLNPVDRNCRVGGGSLSWGFMDWVGLTSLGRRHRGKWLLLAASLAAIFNATAWAGVNITSPLPGTTWTAGQDVEITWTKTADIPDQGRIQVQFRVGGDGPGASVHFFTGIGSDLFLAGDGHASFRIPEWIGDGIDYALILLIAGKDVSTIHEAVVSPIEVIGSTTLQRIELQRPVSGAPWRVGHRHRINFTAGGLDGAVSVQLANDRGWRLSAATARAQDGFAVIDLPLNMPPGPYWLLARVQTTPETHIRRVIPTDQISGILIDGLNEDYEFEVQFPDAAGPWIAGTSREVCWTTNLSSGNVFVSLGSDLDINVRAARATAPLTAGCVLLTPCSYTHGDFFISVEGRLSPASDGFLFRQSVHRYPILGVTPAPTLTLTSPPPGTVVTTGDNLDYVWTATGFDSSVQAIPWIHAISPELLLLVNVHTSLPAATGQVPWNPYPLLGPGIEYTARVCAMPNGCPQVCDSSGPITILPFSNPPLFRVDFSGLKPVYEAGEFASFPYFAAGAEGMTVEVRVQQNDLSAFAWISTEAADGYQEIAETLPSHLRSGRMNRIVVRLLHQGAEVARQHSGPFAVVAGEPTCGDIAWDLLVDLTDFYEWLVCLGGNPLMSEGGPPFDKGCSHSDFHVDQRIDLRDFQVFQNLFGIGSTLSPPNCPLEP